MWVTKIISRNVTACANCPYLGGDQSAGCEHPTIKGSEGYAIIEADWRTKISSKCPERKQK